jgi:hypothetical protein
MNQIRPESPPILRDDRIQPQMSSISMQTDSLAGGKTRSELSPSFSKSPVVHQDQIQSSLMSASIRHVSRTKIWVSTSWRCSVLTAEAMMMAVLANISFSLQTRLTIPVELQTRGLFLILWSSPFFRCDPHRDGQCHKHQRKGEDGGMIDIAMFVDGFERLPKQLFIDGVSDEIDFGKEPVD